MSLRANWQNVRVKNPIKMNVSNEDHYICTWRAFYNRRNWTLIYTATQVNITLPFSPKCINQASSEIKTKYDNFKVMSCKGS